MIIDMSNIYSDFQKRMKAGSLLDRTQPKFKPMSQGGRLIFTNILKKLISLESITQKYGCTLTFKSKFHGDDPLMIHRVTESFFIQYQSKFQYMVFAEFTGKGNLHYHLVAWDCYQLPFTAMIKKWRRSYGFGKPEYNIRYYYCGTEKCSVKKLMLRPKADSKCWLHYIIKDYLKNGLWAITHYTNLK